MRRLLVILAVVGIVSPAMAVWEPIGPYGGYLRALAVAPSDEDIVYAASYTSQSKIYKSIDGGNTWNKAGTINSYIYGLSVDLNNPDIVYAGGYMRVYKSTDGGSTWTGDVISGSSGYINAVSVHPSSSSTIYAVGTGKSGNVNVMAFFKSTDAGSNWSVVTLDNLTGRAYSVAVDPSNPNTIYVGGYSQSSSYIPKIFKSTNGGSTFTDASSGLSSGAYYVYSLAVHPANSNYVYAGTYYGIYRSTNGGSSWSNVGSSYRYIYSLATTKANSNLVFAGNYTYIYKSTNSGSSWTTLSNGLDGYYFYGLFAGQTDANKVFTANNSGFYKSTNSGSSWTASNHGINLASINALLCSDQVDRS